MAVLTATTIALTPGADRASPDVSSPWMDVSPPTITPEGERVSRWNKTIRKMHAMLTLSDDWDGMGAIAPAWNIVFSALELAYALRAVVDYPAPTRVAPTPAGTVGLEWQQPSAYTEVEIVAPGHSEWMQIKDGEEPVHWAQDGVPDTDFWPGRASTSAGTIRPEREHDARSANRPVIRLAWWPDLVDSPF